MLSLLVYMSALTHTHVRRQYTQIHHTHTHAHTNFLNAKSSTKTSQTRLNRKHHHRKQANIHSCKVLCQANANAIPALKNPQCSRGGCTQPTSQRKSVSLNCESRVTMFSLGEDAGHGQDQRQPQMLTRPLWLSGLLSIKSAIYTVGYQGWKSL